MAINPNLKKLGDEYTGDENGMGNGPLSMCCCQQ